MPAPGAVLAGLQAGALLMREPFAWRRERLLWHVDRYLLIPCRPSSHRPAARRTAAGARGDAGGNDAD